MMWLLWVVADLTRSARRLPHRESADPAADAEAVARLAGGDPEALADIYDRHARLVYSLAFRIVGSQDEAEEVVQDVFVQAWKQAAKFDRARGAVVAWLLMMTRSRAIDRLRANRGLPTAGEISEVPDPADPSFGPEVRTLTAEQLAKVHAAIQALPLVQRITIELAYYEGLTHLEIAERLEQPLGTVKTRIRLGLMKVRDAVLETGA